MSAKGITAHMVVKNEDRFVWFAIHSVLPYVDRLLITDTGSTDRTLEVIKTIQTPKIELTQSIVNTPSELTAVRQSQLDKSKTDWIWIVDGDEIYPTGLAEEVLAAIKRGYEGVVVRRYDLLGDIYHRQDERVGEYRLFGHRGHLVTRLLNRSLIKGLHYQGDYPLEGFVDSASQSTRERDSTKWYITKNRLYHAMYLIRSSSGGNLSSVLHRHKYKLERGIPITGRYPDVFDLPRPAVVPDPRHRRPLSYELVAAIVTPVKQLKRRLI